MIVGIYDLRSTERRKITSSVSSQWCFLGVLTGLVIGLSGLTYGADWDFQYEVVWPDLGDTTNDIAVADINSDAWPDVMGKNWSQTDPIQIWCSMLSSMGKAAVDNEIRHSGLSAEKARRWRSAIRAALFIPNPLPQLAVENHGRFEPAEGIVAERVSYATQFAMRVPAIVYSPQERRRDLPALIIVNGHGGDKYSWYAFYSGVLYARAGAVVLTY
ncbi:MAG: hypothetical protein JSW47_09205, partial [Phycisphaerales bacterium]